jgi:hypothetical protein
MSTPTKVVMMNQDSTRRSVPPNAHGTEPEADRRRRRAQFLAELAEARALRERVAPRRARSAKLRAELRRRTFLT